MKCKQNCTSVARRICIIYVLFRTVQLNTMNRRGGAGLIAPCRVQLLSPNQPCASISGDRRAKRLQPAISFRLSAAIKHPSSIGRRCASHTFSRRSGAGTVSGNRDAWQAPGAMSSVQSPPTKSPTVILSHAAAGSVVQMFAGKWGSRPPEYTSRSNDIVRNFVSAGAIILSLICIACLFKYNAAFLFYFTFVAF